MLMRGFHSPSWETLKERQSGWQSPEDGKKSLKRRGEELGPETLRGEDIFAARSLTNPIKGGEKEGEKEPTCGELVFLGRTSPSGRGRESSM